MESEIAADYSPMLRVYKDGRVERLVGETTVPPSLEPQNGVVSKDVVYSPENNLSVRLYLPHKATAETAGRKLPLLVYFHGGGFIIETAFSPTYHNFLTAAVSAANCVAVSVDYRRAPEHPIPAAYEDSWSALKWVFAHFAGSGPEDWLNKHADFGNVILSGDSAGGNIAHHMAMRAGEEKLNPEGKSGISGIILVHPFFWGPSPIDEHETKDEKVRSGVAGIWKVASPSSEDGVDDPRINVVGSGPDLSGLGCGRVLVMVAGKDALVRQGWAYAAKLEKNKWGGAVEVAEAKDESHVFHLLNPTCENAKEMMDKFAGFIKK